MDKIAVIDVGGTNTKYAAFAQGELLLDKGSVKTPDSLPGYYAELSNIVELMKKDHPISGVAISTPGAVNKKTGVIEGVSALPYIHHFPIQKELEHLFRLPVSMENDANCAALAEVTYGAGRGLSNMIFMILGTGVGGSMIVDGKLCHGSHLFGGEFGFMLLDDTHTLSDLGTTVRMEQRYYGRTNQPLDAEEIFDLAFRGDAIAQEESDIFFKAVARGIYNLQYSFDPEKIILGGGVSQAGFLIPELKKQLRVILDTVKISPFMPEIEVCHFKNDANLIGAAVDLLGN